MFGDRIRGNVVRSDAGDVETVRSSERPLAVVWNRKRQDQGHAIVAVNGAETRAS